MTFFNFGRCEHGVSVAKSCPYCLRLPCPQPQTGPSDLAKFLLARVEEEFANGGCGGPDRSCERMADKWLDMCEATKRLASRHWKTDVPYVLRCLSLPWAGHPDYRSEWKP